MFIPKYWLNIKNHMIFLQWFLDRMADDDWWPMQILIKCPNQIVRQVRKIFFEKEGDKLFTSNKLINLGRNQKHFIGQAHDFIQ